MEGLVVLFALGAAGVMLLGLLHSQVVAKSWQQAARRLGLSYDPGGLFGSARIHGMLGPVNARVDTVRRGSGDDQRTYTRYRVAFQRPLSIGLKIRREGFLSGIGKLFGLEDITVGDPGFDSTVHIAGADPGSVRRFLTPSRRLRLHRLLERWPAEIDDHGITVELSGAESDADRLVSVLRHIAEVSRHLVEERPEDVALSAALEARQKGQLSQALQRAQVARRAAPDDDAAEAMVDEVLKMAGQAKAKTAAPTDGRRSPSEAEASRDEAAQRRAPQTTPSITRPPTTNEPPSPVTARAPRRDASDPNAITVATVCNDLFGESMTSFESAERFEERYDGKAIQWTGILEWVDTTSADLVLGSGAGARGAFEICKARPGLMGRQTVRAFVRFADQGPEALRQRVGEPVTFEGRLVSCDAFARNLFVAHGTVVEAR